MKSAPLSETVKEARAESGLTQLEVAVRSGVSLTVVRNIEQGITKNPRYGTVLAILDAIRGHVPDATEPSGDRKQSHQDPSPDLIPSGDSRSDGVKAGAR